MSLEVLTKRNIITVRSANLNDLSEIVKLENEAFSIEDKWGSDAFTNELSSKSRRVRIARSDDKLVGFVHFQKIRECSLIIFQPFDLDDGIIGSIAISKDYRKKGLGEFLLNTAINELKLQHVPRVLASTRNNNMEMQKLLCKTGFEKVGLTRNCYGKGQHAIDFAFKAR